MSVLNQTHDESRRLNGERNASPASDPTRAAGNGTVTLEALPGEIGGSMALAASVSSALEALWANKLRSVLTMLGIIIGVSAVIVMIALGEGASASVQQRLARLGTNLLTVFPGSGNVGGVRLGGGSLPSLKPQDAVAILRQVPGVETVSPNLEAGNIQVVANGQNWNTTVQGDYPTIFRLQDWQIAKGAAFNQNDETSGALVCDIGQTVAQNLFGNSNPVGQRILVRNVSLEVKGVLAPKGSNGFRNQDDIILMPFSTAQVRLFGQSHVNNIYVQVTHASQIATVETNIATLLRQRHDLFGSQPNDFRIFNNNQIVQTVQATTTTLTFLLAGVAAVSLVVGGIGIMNIMLVSVTERTREIGIRMAIGARGGAILSQFLIEALLMSVLGGIVGIVLGLGAADGLSRLAGWQTIVSPTALLLSFGFAATVGIFFGYYPARKAAQLNPIEALRYE